MKAFVFGNILGVVGYSIMPDGPVLREIAAASVFMWAGITIHPQIEKWLS